MASEGSGFTQYIGGVIRKWLHVAGGFFQAGILLYGLGATAFVILRLVSGERLSLVAFGNNFIPWIAGGALLAALLSLPWRWRWLLIACQVPMLATFVVLYGELLLPRGTSADGKHGPELRVVTYNISGRYSDPQSITDRIARLQADVVGLVENSKNHQVLLKTQLADQFPYQVHYPQLRPQGLGLLSRYPILKADSVASLYDSMQHLRAVIDVNGVQVTVLVFNPHTPREWWSPRHYDDQQRDAELAAIREQYLPRETGPVLVLCDCNMTDQSDAYRAMNRLLHDAFREVGHGLGFSFPTGRRIPSLMRIDYVWYNDFFVALSARTLEDGGTSDHRPVLAVLALKQELSSP